jgi:hypothetical protein
MGKNPNYFKTFLENSYQDTFTDPTGKQGKNEITKINGCVKNNVQLEQNTLVILSNNCYSKMSQSENLQLYSECLQQYGVNAEQTESIRNCVRGVQPLICTFDCTIDVVSGGEVEYTSCCGNNVVQLVTLMEKEIRNCLVVGSVKPYEKNSNPAVINGVGYGDKKCDCTNQ